MLISPPTVVQKQGKTTSLLLIFTIRKALYEVAKEEKLLFLICISLCKIVEEKQMDRTKAFAQ